VLAFSIGMANDEVDREEIDRLLQELSAPPKPPPPAPRPAASVQDDESEPAAPAPQNNLAPGRPWTTAKLMMPAQRKERKEPLAFLSALKLPKLPKIGLPTLPGIGSFKLPEISLPKLPGVSLPTLTSIPKLVQDETQWNLLSVRTFVGLGVMLSAAMRYWPYAHAWSWGLLFYLGAVLLLLVTGIWGAKLTWDARLPAAHTVAIGTVVWGLGLLAAETVPRIISV
jgi:hypothetical protein